MSVRYKKIFELPHNLYCEGSPALVCAGALTLDNQTNSVFVQLRIKNISPRNIIAAYVEITPFSVSGDALGDPVLYSYLDLNISRCSDFGSKTPIPLPDNKTRSFSVRITKVVFADNSVAEINDGFEPIPEQKKLTEIYSTNQIRRMVELSNSKCVFVPFEYKDLRICACGEALHSDENLCPSCGADFNTIHNADGDLLEKNGIYSLASQKVSEAEAIRPAGKDDLETLIKNGAFFVAKQNSKIFINTDDIEKKQSLYSSAMKLFESIADWKDSEAKASVCKTKLSDLGVELEVREKRVLRQAEDTAKKLVIAAIVLAAVILVMIISSSVKKNYLIPLSEYKEAVSYAESGDYEEAYSMLNELGDFKDSPEKIKEIKNLEAQSLIKNGNYSEAYEILYDIGNLDAIKESKLERGKILIKNKNFDSGYALLKEIGSYKDAYQTLNNSKYERGKAYIAEGNFKEGYELLNEISNYKDADTLVKESKYSRAKTHLTAQEFNAAYKLFDEIPDYKDSKAIADKSRYDRAVAFFATEEYDNAYALLKGCPDYLDSKKLLSDSSYTRAEEFAAKGDYKTAAELYANVDTVLYPDAAAKSETASQIALAQKNFEKGYYKSALEICEKIQGNQTVDSIAEKCRTYISKIESYCGNYTMDYYGKPLTITVTCDHDSRIMRFECSNSSHSYREGTAKFDINNPGQKLIYKSFGDETQYYYRFSGNNLINQLHNSDGPDTFSKD